ncbi:MAG: hemolysin, partial [Lachnospiraceae bacterium]|nr:hemolysin [Lachnospiraceae bacterium]
LEDLLEEIVGDIKDEYDDEEPEVVHITPNEYLVDGAMRLDELNELIGSDYDSDGYDSIAGYIIDVLQHIPSEKEFIEDDKFKFVVEKMDKNRIEEVHVYIKK